MFSPHRLLVLGLWAVSSYGAGSVKSVTEKMVIEGRVQVPGTEDVALVLRAEARAEAGDAKGAWDLARELAVRHPQSAVKDRGAVAGLIGRVALEPFTHVLMLPLSQAETTGLFRYLAKQGRHAQAAQVADARVVRAESYLDMTPVVREMVDAWQKSGTNLVSWVCLQSNAERRWRYGRLFYRAERYGEAEKIFNSVTPSGPPSAKPVAIYEEGHYYLGSCAMKRGVYAEADAHLKRFLSNWPEAGTGAEDPRTFARSLHINSLERQGRWNEVWAESTNAWAKTGEEKYLRVVFRVAKNLGRYDYPQWRETYLKKFPGSWSIYIQQRDDALNLLLQKKIPEGLALLQPLYGARQSEMRMLGAILTNGDAVDAFARNEEPFFDSLYFDPRGESFFPFPYRERTEYLLDLAERAKGHPNLMELPRAYLFPMEGPKWQQLTARGHAFLQWVDDCPLLPESIRPAITLLSILEEREAADALVRRQTFGNDWERLRARKAVAIAFGEDDKALRQDLLQVENRKGEWNGLPHEFLRRGFPRWHEPLIAHASAVTGVPRHLIWAVMREESHFETDAVSSAGARGLMQIMEFTGRGLLQQAGLSRSQKLDLADPVQNVMLGTRYLGSLLRMFQGDEMKALAGYNGGEGNVIRWQKNNGPFTNAIHYALVVPFDESQRYVVKVLRSKWMYDLLYPESVELFRP